MEAKQALAVGLLVCLAGAVLAFGATEPFSLAAVELLAFLLSGFVLWMRAPGKPGVKLPWKGPTLLLSYVGAQTALVQPGGHLAYEQILQLLACFSVFYVAVVVSGSESSRRRLLLGLLGLGLFEALYGLVQYVSGWQQIFTYKKIFYTTMATGTYINPNHFAGLLEMVLPLSFAWTLYRFEHADRNVGNAQSAAHHFLKGDGIATLVFFSFSTLLIFGGILFSRSRAGIFSASVAAIVVGVLWISSSWRRLAAGLVVLCLLAGAGIFGLWIGLKPVAERFEHIETDYPSRLGAWKDSLALIRARPFWGSGLGSFEDEYTRVQSISLTGVVDHAHNDYLEFAAELGIPCVVLLVGAALWLLARTTAACFRLSQSSQRLFALGTGGSILALLLHSVADFNLHIPANALVLTTVLGMAYSVSSNTAAKSGGERSPSKTG